VLCSVDGRRNNARESIPAFASRHRYQKMAVGWSGCRIFKELVIVEPANECLRFVFPGISGLSSFVPIHAKLTFYLWPDATNIQRETNTNQAFSLFLIHWFSTGFFNNR
jgi:hypothetical protein